MMAEAGNANPTVLDVSDLSVTYAGDDGVALAAVDRVSLTIAEGQVHGLVGESGSGKTSVAAAILGMLSPPAAASGAITFVDHDMLRLADKERRSIRGRLVSFIPQNPMTSLNPVLTVGYQIVETIRSHTEIGKPEARKRAIEALRQVGLPDPERALGRYAYEFSGGTAQRILIAMALVNEPRLVIADEPTSALDATVQRQIIELLAGLVRTRRMAMLLISHDLGTVASLSDRITVMYSGRIVESGPAEGILRRPRHPYTAALVAASRGEAVGVRRSDIDARLLSTCRFLPRCPDAVDACRGPEPRLVPVADGHSARCWLGEAAGVGYGSR
jgi:oligopeptide/dipeptide ABC transporter ATP-binding protein